VQLARHAQARGQGVAHRQVGIAREQVLGDGQQQLVDGQGRRAHPMAHQPGKAADRLRVLFAQLHVLRQQLSQVGRLSREEKVVWGQAIQQRALLANRRARCLLPQVIVLGQQRVQLGQRVPRCRRAEVIADGSKDLGHTSHLGRGTQ